MRKILFNIVIGSLLCCSYANAQNADLLSKKKQAQPSIYVSGKVTDAATKKPIQGVQVSVDRFQAITDADGYFRVGSPSRAAEVDLTCEGYSPRKVMLRKDTLCNAVMYSDAFRSQMASDAFTNATTESSVEEVLATRAGSSLRTISRTAVTAMGANMFIRGYNSLNANAQPLVIVDGVIWDEQTLIGSLFEGSYFNLLADIDVNDIEKVTILKDASAIYGAKGANGAIYITTKQSHSQVTKITVDMSYGFNMKPKTYRTLNAGDYRTYASEMLKGVTIMNDQATAFNGILNLNPSTPIYKTYHNNNDWNNNVFQTGNTQHYGISIDGSDDIAKYAITVGYTGSDGTIKNTDFSRLNSRINSDITLSRRLSADASVYFTYLTRSQFDDGINANTSPTFLASIKSPFMIPYSYTDDGSKLTETLNDVDILGVSNPVAILENSDNSYKHYRFGVMLGPVWKINDLFTFDGRFSYSFTSTKEHYFSPMKGVSPQNVNGDIWENTIQDLSLSQGNIYGDAHLSFAKRIGRHNISTMAGYRIMTSTLKSSYSSTHNTGNDKVTNMSGKLDYTNVEGTNISWGNMALMAKAEYSYDGRYNLWGTITEEASSRFGENARSAFRMLGGSWGTFPSIGASWNMGKEAFMKGQGAIDQAILYISYGTTGNDDIDGMKRYSYLQGVRYLTNSTGLAIGSLANSKLKWESTRKFNVGINLSTLNDRLGISFDYFLHKTQDLLMPKTADLSSGKETYLYNGGKMENKGFEVSIQAKPIVLKNFSWFTSLDFQHYKNTITELPDGNYSTKILDGEVLTGIGQPAALFHGYKTKGVFATTEQAQAANLKVQNKDASYSTFTAGDVWFEDLNNDGVINDKDKQIIGDPNPDITGSWTNRFTYKRFELDVLCTYSLGGDIYNYNRQQLESMSTLWNQTEAVLNRWKKDGQITNTPRATYGDPMGNSRFSDRWIEDGSYFKIKNVKLSYNIPIEGTYIHGITLWTAMSNVFTFTKYLGIDPEVSMNSNVLYQGIDNGQLAAGRSMYMGVKINL